MATAALATQEQQPETEDVKRVAFDLPVRLLDWLDAEALRRKQARRDSRVAKSPIIVELIERAMEEDAAEKDADGGAK
jgi:transcriptional regulator of met regulon